MYVNISYLKWLVKKIFFRNIFYYLLGIDMSFQMLSQQFVLYFSGALFWQLSSFPSLYLKHIYQPVFLNMVNWSLFTNKMIFLIIYEWDFQVFKRMRFPFNLDPNLKHLMNVHTIRFNKYDMRLDWYDSLPASLRDTNEWFQPWLWKCTNCPFHGLFV